MKNRIAVVVALTLLVGPFAGGATSQSTPCAELAGLTIPDITINAAAMVAGGHFTPPGSTAALTVPLLCAV